MDRIIQLIQTVHSEVSALAWLALGILLPGCIIMGLIAFIWIRRGGLSARSTQEFFAEQKQIARWLKDADL